ncbi:hypothetical protein GW916_02615 [bacterium]|nr:hypothetical protein [bacterium]
MRFFVKTLKLLIFAATLNAHSKQLDVKRLPGSQFAKRDLYQGLSIKNLEVLEFDRPQDPYLKEALLKQYWCAGERGLALNINEWIQRHGPSSMKLKWQRNHPYMRGLYARAPADLSNCQASNDAK